MKTIYYNGAVYTGTLPLAEAFAVENGRFLFAGTNEEAKALARLIGGYHGHVNLIPVNPIKERDYVQSNREAVEAFKNYLERQGINVTVRREMGRDIGGACGQLRKSYMDRKEA